MQKTLYLVLLFFSCNTVKFEECNNLEKEMIIELQEGLIRQVKEFYYQEDSLNSFKKKVIINCCCDTTFLLITENDLNMVGHFVFDFEGNLLSVQHMLPPVF